MQACRCSDEPGQRFGEQAGTQGALCGGRWGRLPALAALQGCQMLYSRRTTGLMLCAALGLLAQSAAANPQLNVTASAAFVGLFGLEVTVVPCSAEADVVLPGPSSVSGVFEACETLRAQDIEIVSPGATFRAGDIVLENGFRVAEGAAFQASDLTSFAWVEDHTPLAEKTYNASYYVNLDGLPLVEGEDLDNLVGVSPGTEVPQFRIFFQRNAQFGEDRLLIAARLDNGSTVTTAWAEGLVLPSGWNFIEVEWKAAPGEGYFVVTLNGSTSTELTDLDNHAGAIDSIRWGTLGADSNFVVETAGFLYLDEFRSWR